jgi:hypothetical protein
MKTLNVFSIVTNKCYYKNKHINAIRGLCHGNIFYGEKVAFVTHVSRALKDFVFENLELGHSIS